MPNWTWNTVEIWGSSEVLNNLKDLFGSEESVFDFEKVIPLPSIVTGDSVRDAWGTRFNASEAELIEFPLEDCIVYKFNTAWDAPRVVAQFIYDNHLNEADWCNWYCLHEEDCNDQGYDKAPVELLIGDKEDFFAT